MLTNQAKIQIMESLLETVNDISDKEYQQRVWIRAEGPECDDIDDTICDFFDEGNSILDNYKDFQITETQYELLMKLHGKLRNFTDAYGVYTSEKSTEKLIELPKWQEIRVLSKKILQAFNFPNSRKM